ncbi:MAG TPA: NUDIX domain-containing protein [Rhizomicrobium sp.]
MRLSFLHRSTLALSLAVRAYLTPLAFGTMGLITNAEGRVLVVRHRYMPGLGLPGGGAGPGEPPAQAVVRELGEELGLSSCAMPELFGLYTRKVGWTTNLVALYRLRDAVIAFKPSLEISAIAYVDPANPPDDTSPATRRRLAEFTGAAPIGAYW